MLDFLRMKLNFSFFAAVLVMAAIFFKLIECIINNFFRMKTSKKGLEFLKQHEGEKLQVYKDSGGYLTVGVGHLVLPSDNLSLGDVITQDQSDKFLKFDVQKAEKIVNKALNVPVTQNMFDALVSHAFNTGKASETIYERINSGRIDADLEKWWVEHYITVTDSLTGKKRVVPGLIQRRYKEVSLWS